MKQISKGARLRLQMAWGYRCGYCCRDFQAGRKKHRFTVDHYLPLSTFGGNRLENLVAACARCNTEKGSQDALKWMESKGLDIVLFLERRDRWCTLVYWYRWRFQKAKPVFNNAQEWREWKSAA